MRHTSGVVVVIALVLAAMPAPAVGKQIEIDPPDASIGIERSLRPGDGSGVVGFVEGEPGREPFAHNIEFHLDVTSDPTIVATWCRLPPCANTRGVELTARSGTLGGWDLSIVELERPTAAQAASFAALPPGDDSLLIGGLFMADIATYDAKIAITPLPGATVLPGTAAADLGLVAPRRRLAA
jgi:hypothetical protein